MQALTQNQGCTYRGIKLDGAKPKKVKDEYGDIYYEYRGKNIYRNEGIASGYYDSW